MANIQKPYYPNLVAEIARNGEILSSVAAKMGVSMPTLRRQLSGLTQFSLDEAFRMRAILHLDEMPLEVLFQKRENV